MSEAEPKRETQSQTAETGRRLREAREAKRQSVAEVADSLHLRPSIVSAIEEGDYRQIPGELFLKGYVRSYARHVGLDEESTVEILDRELEPLREEDERARVEHPLEEIQRKKDSRRRLAKIVGLTALIVIAVGAYMEFAGQSHMQMLGRGASSPSTAEEGAGVSSAPTATVADGSSADVPAEMPAAPTSAPAAVDGATAARTTSTPAASGPEAQTGVSSAPAASTAPSSATETGAAIDDTAPAADTAKSDSTSPAATGSSPAALAGATLTASFSGNCWVEVTNGDGVKVVASLKQAGDSLDYRGPPPFRVVLGAVSQVGQLSYNGNPVNLNQYPAPGNRAEFVLGSRNN